MQKPGWLKGVSRANIRAFLKTERAVLILCMGAALLFWVINKFSQTFRVEYTIPVHYSLPEGYTLLTPAPEQIRVVISGRGWTLLANSFQQGKRQLQIPVETAAGETVISSTRLRNLLMRTVGWNEDIISFSQDQLILHTDRLKHKEINLHLQSDIKCAKGFQLGAPLKLLQERITVSGPATLIDTLVSWQTDTLHLSGLQKGGQYEVALRLHPNRLVQFSTPTALVQLVVEQSSEKRFLVRLAQEQLPTGYHIFPDVISLTSNIALSRYQEATANDFEVTVNLPASGELKNKGVLTLHAKPKVMWAELVDFHPKSVSYNRSD